MRVSLKTVAVMMFCIAISIAWYADRSRLAERLRRVKLDLHIATLESELNSSPDESNRASAMSQLAMFANSQVADYEDSEILTRYIPMLINALDDHEFRIAFNARNSLEAIATRLDSPLEIELNGMGVVDKEELDRCWSWYENILAEIDAGSR